MFRAAVRRRDKERAKREAMAAQAEALRVAEEEARKRKELRKRRKAILENEDVQATIALFFHSADLPNMGGGFTDDEERAWTVQTLAAFTAKVYKIFHYERVDGQWDRDKVRHHNSLTTCETRRMRCA